MPITGKFVADFTSFNDAVNKATANLKGMETDANKVGTSLNRMVDQFSGRKIIQEAELMGQTFELLATKGIGLTNSELKRMGAVAEEAMAKLRAGGEPIPAKMQAIADAANKIKPAMDSAQSSTATFASTVQKAAATFGIAFSVGAITRFVGSVLDTASAIGDLSQQLGVSAEAVQRFKYAAEQSGSSMDAVGTSIQFMNKTLGAEGGGTKKALADVGLNFDEIRKMRPEDAFVAISDALGGMDDKAKQASAGAALLGRGFAELLPAMEDGIKKVGDQTSVMTDQTIADLKRAQDAWESLWNSVVVSTGNAIASIKNVVTSIDNLQKAMRFGPGGMGFGILSVGEDERIKAVAKEMDQMARKGGAVAEAWGKIKGEIGGATMSAEDLDVVYKELDRTYQSTGKSIAANTAAAEKLDEAMRKAATAGVKAFKDFHTGIENVNHQMGLFVNKHLKELGEQGQRVLSAAGEAAVRLGLDMSGLHPVIVGLDKDFMNFTATGIRAMDTLKEVIAKLPKTFDQSISEIEARIRKWLDVSLADVERAFGPRAAAAVGQLQQLTDDTFQAMHGLARVMAGDFSGFVDLVVGGINSIKTQWKLMIGLFNQREGRHAVEDFAASFGGFDALHDQLLKLGDAGEQLWIKLTQGTAAGNADAAARVIAEIEEALGKQADAADEVTAATEEQAQATIETASQAAKALEELGPKIDTNKDEWKSWGDVVTAQIQRIADGVRTIGLPTVPGAAAIGAGAGGGNGGLVVQSNLYLDGDVAATSVSRAALGW